MNITRLCLIRHGETNWNAERRLQGITDIPLNERGKLQALQVAQAIRTSGLQFDALYSSDLQRAADTANAIENLLNVDTIFHQGLRERHFGALQGLTVEDAPHEQPLIWQAHLSRDINHDLNGGESIARFAQRVQDTLEQVRIANPGKTVLLVSHGGFLDMAHRLTKQQALDEKRAASVPNASFNWLTHNGTSWEIGAWADTRHLENISLENVDL
jgi:2,3-bisphosphoglycerate-dependent phosphoglycerate mutase